MLVHIKGKRIVLDGFQGKGDSTPIEVDAEKLEQLYIKDDGSIGIITLEEVEEKEQLADKNRVKRNCLKSFGKTKEEQIEALRAKANKLEGELNG